VGFQRHALAALLPVNTSTHCIGDLVGPRAVWTGAEKLAPHRDSIPDRPALSGSLYRLSDPGPPGCSRRRKIFEEVS